MEVQIIQNKIYEIRGYKVMLDFDLAALYQVETRTLKQAVRRNIERFEGDDFMFEISESEYNALKDSLRSQIVISNLTFQNGIPNERGGRRHMPFAFTEIGVAMLSSVLRSETAILVNRGVMRAFVALRQLLLQNPADKTSLLQQEMKDLKQYIEEVFSDQNDINEDTRIQLELINNTLATLQAKNNILNKPRKAIGFKTGSQALEPQTPSL